MNLGLEGKTVFVAGASRGIGLGIAEACLAEGAKVALAARGEDRLEQERARLAGEFGDDNVWARAGDLRDSRTVDTMIDTIENELGELWGAVANVGLHPCPPGFEVDDETWDGGISQNLDSAVYLARSALRRMLPRGEGAMRQRSCANAFCWRSSWQHALRCIAGDLHNRRGLGSEEA